LPNIPYKVVEVGRWHSSHGGIVTGLEFILEEIGKKAHQMFDVVHMGGDHHVPFPFIVYAAEYIFYLLHSTEPFVTRLEHTLTDHELLHVDLPPVARNLLE